MTGGRGFLGFPGSYATKAPVALHKAPRLAALALDTSLHPSVRSTIPWGGRREEKVTEGQGPRLGGGLVVAAVGGGCQRSSIHHAPGEAQRHEVGVQGATLMVQRLGRPRGEGHSPQEEKAL